MLITTCTKDCVPEYDLHSEECISTQFQELLAPAQFTIQVNDADDYPYDGGYNGWAKSFTYPKTYSLNEARKILRAAKASETLKYQAVLVN